MKLTEKDGWKHTFRALAKTTEEGTEIVYTVTEDAVEGYETVIDGYKITNKHTPEETTEETTTEETTTEETTTEETTTKEETTSKEETTTKEEPKPTPKTDDPELFVMWIMVFLIGVFGAALWYLNEDQKRKARR